MVDRTKEGCGDVSDNGVDEALQGFVLIRKIEREMDTKVCAGHEQFNRNNTASSTPKKLRVSPVCMYTYITHPNPR